MTIPRNLSFLAEGASSTGVLGVANGGTGNVTLPAGYINYGNGTGAFNSSSNLTFDGTNLSIGGAVTSTIASKTAAFGAAGGSIYTSYYDGTKTWRSGSGIQIAGVYSFYDVTDATTPLNLFPSGGVSIGNTTDPGATNLSVTGSISGASVSSTGTVSGAGIVSTINGTQLTLQRLGPSATNTMSCGGSGELAFVNSSANAFTLYNTYAFFPTAATTASAANAFINNGSSGYANQLLRSTSSLKYKTNVEDLLPEFSKLIYKLRPIWYRSLAESDNKEWSWYGLAAEEVALIEPRLVHWTYEDNQYDYVSIEIEGSNQKRRILKSDAVKTPDGIQYDRISILLLKELQQLRSEFDAYVASHP